MTWSKNPDGDNVNPNWEHTCDGDYRPKNVKHSLDGDLIHEGKKTSQREFDRERSNVQHAGWCE